MSQVLVRELSESELLAHFLPIIGAHNERVAGYRSLVLGEENIPGHMILGPGDDSAVFDFSGAQTVMSIDTQTENQDFRRHWNSGVVTGGYEVGWKAATQNLADIAAMGARASSLLVSLTLTELTPVQWVTDFAQGLTDCCWITGAKTCSIGGGDLGAGTELSITVCASGTCKTPVLRTGAKVGDTLAYAGDLGTAGAGLALLESPAFSWGQDERLDQLVLAQQKPVAALQAGLVAGEQKQPAHSMLDISDGLLRDAGRIAHASGVMITVNTSALTPALNIVRPAAEFLVAFDPHYAETSPQELAQKWVLSAGETHAMLATFSEKNLPDSFTAIGTCTPVQTSVHWEKTGDRVLVDGKPWQEIGWDHFG